MKQRALSLILAAATVLSLPTFALADGEEAPAPEEAAVCAELISQGEEETFSPAEPGEEDPVAVISAYSMPSGGVTMNITGAMEGIQEVSYYGTDGTFPGWKVSRGDTIPSQYTGLQPGEIVDIWLDPEYRLTAEGATVLCDDYFHDIFTSHIDGRKVLLRIPAGGTINIHVELSGELLPKKIPTTEYNMHDGGWMCTVTERGWVGYGETDEYGVYHGWVTSDAMMCLQLAPGYTVEVIRGGRVKSTGAFGYPTLETNSIGVHLEVDRDADEFVYAVVKQGEHFQVPEETAPEPDGFVPVHITGATELFQKLCYYGPGGSLETAEGGLVPAGATALVYLTPEGTLTVENGTLITNRYDVGLNLAPDAGPDTVMTAEGLYIYARIYEVIAPWDGAVTVTIAPSDESLPGLIPVTVYNNDPDIIRGADYTGCFWTNILPDGTEQPMIANGASMKVTVKQGYTLEVLKGGQVTETGLPTTADWHPDCIAVTVQADMGADELVIAAVKQGEHFQLPEPDASPAFRDVADDSWYHDAVLLAYDRGIVRGTAADTFSPNGLTTRGQAVTMLHRVVGSPAAGGGSFADISGGEVASAALWARSAGVANGVTEAAFAPDSAITREQLVTMLYRMAGQPEVWAGGMMERFSDADAIQEYARPAMQWAVDGGLITGYGDGTIRPGGYATRAEVCALLMRFVG